MTTDAAIPIPCTADLRPWFRGLALLTFLGSILALLPGCATPEPGSGARIATEVVTLADFNRVVRESGLPAVVVFYQPGCPYCQMVLSNQVPDWVARYAGKLNVVLVDMSTAPEITREYNVHTPPTYLLFKNGQLQKRLKGYRPAIFFSGSVKALMRPDPP